MSTEVKTNSVSSRIAWNKGRLVGQKRPLRPKEVWAIRVRLQMKHRKRDLALFNLAIDSKLRGCDLVSLRVRRHRGGRPCERPGDDYPTQDLPAGSVRDHGADPSLGAGVVGRATGGSRPYRKTGNLHAVQLLLEMAT